MCKLLVLSLVAVFGVSVGQILQDGQCDPNIQMVQNFNIDNFIGKWYEIRITDTDFAGDCSSIEFTTVGTTISTFHQTVRQNFYQEHQGQATVPANTARLTLNLPTLSSSPIDYWVLNTDYTSFALTYGCENVGNTQRRVYLWQLGRETAFPNLWISANLNTLMTNLLGVTNSDLKEVSHGDDACYQLPVISPGQPVILPGQCNANINGIANFEAPRFLGVWHQIQSYFSENAVNGCNRAQYSDGGDRVNVVNSQIINRRLSNIEGYATVIGNDGRGRLNVVLEVSPGVLAESELLILGTDYDQWAVTYTCTNLENNRRQVFSWVASRTRQLPAAAQAQVNQLIGSYVELNDQYYQATDQSDASCFYIPEPVANEPVVFGGQCDLNIPVVSNFAAADYMGLWHEIERYPTPFQFGACNNAFYTLGDAGVDVFNTQVLDEKLLTINGVAVPVDDGKLIVSFPVENTDLTTETPYWVLSTDYTSYSFVYSCRNINDYQQQVTFWKLSRTKQLSNQAQTQINAVISSLDILDQQFFQATDQSAEACFYYPDPQPGVPVVFPGTCEANIPVVPNFDVARFQGEWFEVQAYPKDPQEGQCINHQFSAGTGSAALNFISSNVDDQLLATTNGQLTFYPGQTGGRFTLSFVSNGQTISFPYYVIATDYTDYALVYSCVNIPNSDFRGIYAWKLSRTKQLSNNGNTQINNAIASSTTVVLRNEYFEPIDQSDNACFYFPDLAPGAPVILPGQCEANLPVIQNFNAGRYLGRWRLIQSYPSDDQNGQCNQATYSLGADGNVIVYNTEVVNQNLVEINGVATLVGNQNEGKLSVTFPGIPEPFEIWVLDTDYDSYSLVYGCTNVNNQQRRVFSWKLSRTTSLTPAAVAAINAVTSNIDVLNDRYYQNIDQSDAACFYYPTPGSGPTVFRGQCDENIPVVTGFDPVAYMGLWHDIESYAMPFQDGECPNAFYTLDGQLGRVEVFNTQVLSNQKLDTITGYAELVPSTDNSAKLLVTFPSLGFNEPTPYWVLSTDYTSYSLVYSCQNIDEEYRAVTSWKLSRTKSLSQNAANTINGIVNSIPVLDARYYNVRDQSPEGCFYYPDPQPGVPVVFPGTCEANIPVVPNFDVARFQGEWFEVEAYPKDPQEGQCVNHQFSAGTGSAALNFVSSSIDNQLLGTTNGQLTFYPGQTGGRFTLSFVSNGQTISFPYYVIATDYVDYALVYSCINIPNSDFRGVYAWKLSRTKQLSNNGNTQINNAIASSTTVVLRNEYFEPIDQSDNACFYLPDLAPGAPVILPGQCEANLPVVQNFNAGRYLGRWRLIQSYPSDDQNGQCNQATYSLGSDGNVIVYNTEVVNQNLVEINGVATLVGSQNEGKLSVTFPNIPEPFEIWVLDTDYDSYSLVYGCRNVNNQQRRVFSWKLSRTTSLTPAAVAAINTVTSNIDVLNDRYYQNIDQSDSGCFYYPTPGSGPTVFRGQCDENIPVVTGFDPVAYMGLWHDIESYAMPFQNGECPNAFYTLDGQLGRVEVFNTQVLSNQKLDTITGYAELVPSTDNSAKLLVTFPSLGFNEPTPYWVLSTDYTSYSLVYSCQNIDEEYRAVTSWKLSRTKSLSQNAVNIINGIVNSIPVLDARYYNVRDQSPEGCFYYPDPQPGVPVVFPGTCEANIPVVPNFDVARFQGEWFEVEAYPKDPQEGQCVNHQFSAGTGSAALNFVSSSIDNQLQGTTNGQLTFYPGQTGGRFTLSFVSNGQTISFPYYVIATDYVDYALVYSCVNIPNSDFRGVYAWKLSRTKQLSNNGNTQINNAIASSTTVVLRNEYFEPIDQSDNACFYFPDLAPGAPVILPGQCEANLPVVQNFNAGRYLGRWRLIQSYPADDQNGQCNQATYSLGADGNVIVYNTEVVNQNLVEINGVATLVGNQNEGKLSVTFPNIPEPFEIWVLDTDYDSYSLVYGCRNVNNQQRRVFSWKLSRTTSLTPAAVAAINAVTSNIDVLNDRYYQNIDQSDAACFYYPTPGSGPTVFRGQCDENIPVVTGFDPVAYMGLWHDIESYAMPFQDGECPNAFYTLDEQLGRVDVFNTQVLSNQTLDTITGYAELVSSTDNSAKLLVTFPSLGFNVPTPYWVLSTDYTSYSLVYSCQNIDEENRAVTSWKLSRTKTLSQNAANIINGIVNSIPVLDARYYNVRDQSREGCFYYPEPEPGVPVVFPGQCDANINVVRDFNLNRFSGVWYEIEAYPKEEQTGDCINHAFTINSNSNGLNLQSYNVIAQSLGVTEGSVRFTFNDNTARMTITFTSNGRVIEIPYWIIETDYDNYALAYSCVDINNDFRGVYGWKLSRSKQLRPVDNTAINNAIANIDVLGNQYYETIDQSDQACFFYPVPAPGQKVVFPGRCADISAMPNFNAAAYLGLWRTIESYPSEFQRGTCGDATYTLGNDGVVVVYNTEVVDERLSTIYGTAVPANDGTGKLYVTFPDAPSPVEYLVLDTDYETYSLVYSCVNSIDSDERTVYSWKLGRSNTLPPAAVTAISNKVNSIDVLDQRYYETIDRSPTGCFYFPEPQPAPSDSPYIFRGQCDVNVPVQPNFDASAYTGIWYSIESYPAPFQGGTCGTASYTLDPVAGVVLVENTQVLNEVLDVQTGIARVVDNAKLAVTFEVNGVSITTDYWILATDYTSFSLVYSCQNIDSEYKQVNSWKLSRSKSLTPAAVTAINNAIGNVKVLEQRYYQNEGQSEEDCFFYPDNNGGDVILNGQCLPDNQVLAVTNFNTNLFSGVWHEVARFPSDLQNGECVAANFAIGTQNNLAITQTFVKDELQSSGTISSTVSDGRGVFITSSGEVPFDALYVLSTDYQEYALLYGCRNLENNLKQVYSWKLARSRSGLSPAANSVLDQLISSNIDLFANYYSNTLQTNDACFHYPVFDQLPEAIELPGPCDDRIRGVSNFDAAAYTGLWIEIERYPQANQFGTCDRAFYSPGDGNVLVRNTQVVDNSLLVQLGTAEVASTDGTGQLNVNFNVNGVEVTANYFILATDYSNYALVYSCRNINVNNEEKSLVSSWKLSRTTTLSNPAQTAINAVIEQTRGLNPTYYKPTSQSAEDCFYIPEPNPNSAPLFRGRCEAVSGVANFDANRYVGWWHELERYPVDGSMGQCTSSQYSASGNTFQVVDTSVANGEADIVTGTVTVTNDGRLRRVLSNGVTEEVVVLATDYDNYALLYSCVDVTVNGEDYRRVWSAKHSKSRDLSSVNVGAINQIIASNNVLYDQFYQEVDQTNQACFHYPEVEGQRVILPGQCDLNIPVVQNIDVAAYGGTWYQIERYPQVHENQDSTCIGARYVLGEEGVVNVLNWEVIDGELETIEGTAVLSSDDGSAKLDVTLPVIGTDETVTTPLYVLATDYNTYSLVYSCSNVNQFQRSIGAWKLSRERTMSPAGNTAINSVISMREELDARYFRPVVHTDECIEPHSSGTLVRSSVIIMLVCTVLQMLY